MRQRLTWVLVSTFRYIVNVARRSKVVSMRYSAHLFEDATAEQLRVMRLLLRQANAIWHPRIRR
jgi:hypothetical protein